MKANPAMIGASDDIPGAPVAKHTPSLSTYDRTPSLYVGAILGGAEVRFPTIRVNIFFVFHVQTQVSTLTLETADTCIRTSDRVSYIVTLVLATLRLLMSREHGRASRGTAVNLLGKP